MPGGLFAEPGRMLLKIYDCASEAAFPAVDEAGAGNWSGVGDPSEIKDETSEGARMFMASKFIVQTPFMNAFFRFSCIMTLFLFSRSSCEFASFSASRSISISLLYCVQMSVTSLFRRVLKSALSFSFL